MNLSFMSPILSMLYQDKVDIYSATVVSNSDGTSDTIYPQSPTYSNIPCKLSFSNSDDPKDSEIDENPISLLPKIICSINIDIEAGDYIIAYRLDNSGNVLYTYNGYSGLPNFFKSHKEVQMLVKESA